MPKRLGPADVKDRSFGYGPEGKSVQEQPHGKFTDRDIVRATLLSGLPRIPCNVACNNMKAKMADGKRRALPQRAWRSVLEAGLVGCPILRLENDGREAVLKAIPQTPAEKVDYHNAPHAALWALVEGARGDHGESEGETGSSAGDAQAVQVPRRSSCAGQLTRNADAREA